MARQAYTLIDGAWVPTGGPPGAAGPSGAGIPGPPGEPGAPGADGIPNVRYWQGSAGVGAWQPRPSLPAGVHCDCYSVLDPLAPPPPNAVAGDLWKRAPGAAVA